MLPTCLILATLVVTAPVADEGSGDTDSLARYDVLVNGKRVMGATLSWYGELVVGGLDPVSKAEVSVEARQPPTRVEVNRNRITWSFDPGQPGRALVDVTFDEAWWRESLAFDRALPKGTRRFTLVLDAGAEPRIPRRPFVRIGRAPPEPPQRTIEVDEYLRQRLDRTRRSNVDFLCDMLRDESACALRRIWVGPRINCATICEWEDPEGVPTWVACVSYREDCVEKARSAGLSRTQFRFLELPGPSVPFEALPPSDGRRVPY